MSGQSSPAILQPPPTRAPGVKRLNKVPYVVVGGGVLMVVCAVAYTAITRHQQSAVETAATDDTTKKPKGGGLPAFLTWPEDHGAIQATVTKPVEHGVLAVAEKPAVTVLPTASAAPSAPVQQAGPPDLEEQARARAWAAYYRQVEAVQQARFDASVAGRRGDSPQANQASQSIVQPPTPPTSGQQGTGGNGLPYSTGGTDPAAQTGKQAFLRTPSDVLGLNEDLPGAVHGPKASTIMEGEFIPLRLVEGATSDSPGQLVSEVTTNVYDTETGDLLLIPQWTRFIGEYDVAVSAGQDRIGVIWHRMRFPDTSSRQIGTVQGADQGGLAGAKDKLNTHLWDKFSSALLISLVGAGTQLAQPPQSAFSYSPTSSATGQFTQQFQQLGQAYAQRGLQIPNTIELRPGLQLMAKVNKDWTLPVYVDHREISQTGP